MEKNGQKAWLCAQTVVILHRQKEKKVSQDKGQRDRDQRRYWLRQKVKERFNRMTRHTALNDNLLIVRK